MTNTEPKRTFAIDFETYYKSDKDGTTAFSLKDVSMYKYVNDPRFDALLVSVVDNTSGFKWVGDPKKFDWSLIDGALCLAHNAQFETTIVERLVRDGTIPAHVRPAAWADTADMSAFLRVQRNLKNAAKWLLNKEITKEILKSMDGMTRDQLFNEPTQLEAVSKYCLLDSVTTHELWTTCGSQWPEDEREISRLNREACHKGFLVDTQALRADIKDLTVRRHNAAMKLPWFEGTYKGLLSMPYMRAQARLDGIDDLPSSMAKNSPEAMLWENKYSDRFPWVSAIRDVRRLGPLVKKFELLRDGLRDDNTFPYQLKYHGAGPGRFTSGYGDEEDDAEDKVEHVFNPLNMPKRGPGTVSELYGADLRAKIIPRPGKVFMVYDYRQVEAVILLYLAGDMETLDLVKSGMSIYEAHARSTMGWTGGELKKENKQIYQFAKARVLGGGYGIGAAKFKKQFLPDESLETCTEIVKAYRAANPKVVARWRKHDLYAKFSANQHDPTYEYELKSGRTMTYYNPRWDTASAGAKAFGRRLWGDVFRGGTPKGIYGGLLTENEVQGTARDVLCAGWRALDKVVTGAVLLTVYDDFMIEIDKDRANEAGELAHILDTAASEWLPGCPISGDWKITEHY